MDLASPLSIEALQEAIETKLLSRFPRFRGCVDEEEKHWCVPDKVDPANYVVPVELTAPTAADEADAMREHVQKQMSLPLPPGCSWNVHLVTYSGSQERCSLLWRVAHTVADGVVLAQIMSRVICEELPPQTTAATAEAATPAAVLPTNPSAPKESEATVLPIRRAPRAGILERVWRFICGVFFVIALPFWPADVHTILQLGPNRWRKRLHEAEHARGVTVSKTDVPGAHQAGKAGVHIALGKPVAISELRTASAATSCTINDLLMTAMAAAIREYLTRRQALPPQHQDLSLTAVAVINPRPTMPQDMSSDELLRDYAAMKGPGCDITLLLLPLPCGEMPPAARRAKLCATTRRLKLSPESYLLRLGANLVTWLVGLQCLVALYTVVLAKFTLYVSCAHGPPHT